MQIYEKLKNAWGERQGHKVDPWQGAICGSVAGVVAGSLTTPLDVAKTRLMLGVDANGVPYKHMTETLGRIYSEGGVRGLFSGLGPRCGWISLGGLVYFGAYEEMVKIVSSRLD